MKLQRVLLLFHHYDHPFSSTPCPKPQTIGILISITLRRYVTNHLLNIIQYGLNGLQVVLNMKPIYSYL